jgi:hypothetical protein
MRKIIIFCSILVLYSVSCTPNFEKGCDVSDPLTDLPWLKNRIPTSESNNTPVSVDKVILKEKKTGKKMEGFRIGADVPDYLTEYYDCSGNVICVSGGIAGLKCDKYEVIESENIYP